MNRLPSVRNNLIPPSFLNHSYLKDPEPHGYTIYCPILKSVLRCKQWISFNCNAFGLSIPSNFCKSGSPKSKGLLILLQLLPHLSHWLNPGGIDPLIEEPCIWLRTFRFRLCNEWVDLCLVNVCVTSHHTL